MTEKISIKKILIDQKSVGDSVTSNIVDWHKKHKESVDLEYIDDYKDFIQTKKNYYSFYDKNILLIHPYEGKFLSTCPGSDGVVCCNYFVLNTGINCPFDCSYCYLQSYTTHPFITIHSNLSKVFVELDIFLNKRNNFHYRIGTGEYSDSFALDEISGINSILINYFNNIPNATLELKTKSSRIDHLLNKDGRNIVIAWSLNPSKIIEDYEYNTSSLEERIDAAYRATQAGFQIAFHFDPIISIGNWKKEYSHVIHLISRKIDKRKIRWISLGMFRYSSGFREMIKINKPSDKIISSEMVRGLDQKFRYVSYQRVGVYRFLREEIQRELSGVFTYLCMETMNVWKRSCGFSPGNPLALNSGFENRRKEIDPYGTN